MSIINLPSEGSYGRSFFSWLPVRFSLIFSFHHCNYNVPGINFWIDLICNLWYQIVCSYLKLGKFEAIIFWDKWHIFFIFLAHLPCLYSSSMLDHIIIYTIYSIYVICMIHIPLYIFKNIELPRNLLLSFHIYEHSNIKMIFQLFLPIFIHVNTFFYIWRKERNVCNVLCY